MRLSKHLLTVILFLFPCIIYSQAREDIVYHRDYLTKFDQYGTEDGLSSRKILDIYQDQFGYIWIATQEGLDRFDGYSFITYKHHEDDSTTISNNHITSITEDKYGTLWVGTVDGLNQFNRATENFTTIRHKETADNSLSNNYVRTMYADTSGFLWIETVDGVLNKYNIKQKSFRQYIHNKIKQPYYEYHDIYQDKEGYLWIGGRTMGPYRFDIEEGKFQYYQANSNDPQKKRDNDVGAFLEDSRGTFWISGIDGIYRFNKGNGIFTKFYGTSTFDILEDEKGDIWFATGNGILRYDYTSRRLLHYRSDQDNPHSITDDDVNCIVEDNSGNLWFGTDNGISRFSPKKYKFSHIYHIPGNNKTIISNKISALMQDKEGYLWVGTDGYGLDKINLEDFSIQHYQENDKKRNGLASNNISDLYQDKNGDIWIGLWRGIGFNKYNPETDDFNLYRLNPNSLKSDWYNDFLEDSEGNFWAGIWGSSGMQQFNRQSGEFTGKTFNPLDNNPINKRITALAFDGERFLWVGCRNVRSLYRYDYLNDEFSRIEYEIEHKECDKSGAVSIIHLNDYTVIARKDGLNLYNKNKDQFRCYGLPEKSGQLLNIKKTGTDSFLVVNTTKTCYKFITSSKTYQTIELPTSVKTLNAVEVAGNKVFFNTEKHFYECNIDFQDYRKLNVQLKNYRVTSLLFQYPHKLWIGTKEGLYKHDIGRDSTIAFKRKDKEKGSPEGDLITKLYLDSEKNIWIGSIHGLSMYNPSKDLLISYRANKNKPHTLISDHILSIEEDNRGNYWIGTQNGLCLLGKDKNRFVSYNKPDKHSLTSRLTTVMYEDSHGNIWVGTSDKGLNRISIETKTVDHFTHKSYDSTTISDNGINCIYEDSQGQMWIGTENGLNRFLGLEDGFQHYYKEDGLSDSYIMAILEDDSANLWISTENGLTRFNQGKDGFESFYNHDGLQSNRFSKAHTKLADGRLVFGGENGINLFDPMQLNKNQKIPVPQITLFKKFDQVVKADFTKEERIVLNHKENFFTIHFSSMDFTAPEMNNYMYKLEGVDEKWVKADNINQASYTAIDPGEYVFKVRGTNNDNLWGNQPATLHIKLKPPFYRTGWFVAGVISLFGLLILLYIHLRLLGLKKEKYNVELEQRLLRSQMNPHFIFNSLTSIQNFVLENETKRANHYLAKFSKLLRLILDNSRHNYITLNQEIQTIEHYLLLQKIRYGSRFDYFIDYDEEMDKQSVAIPPMLTQPFIENAIEHGFQSIDYKGELFVKFKLYSTELLIEVKDNGIGILKSKALKNSKSGSHKSLATKITEERIQNINRFKRKKIRLKIEDLSRRDKKGTGTLVKLFIPFVKNSGEIPK